VRVGVIGGGRVGSALAASWREAGHDVRVSTRETVTETAADAEVVVLALPARAVADAIEQIGSLAGTVLVDATNNFSGGPTGLEIAELASEAAYAKALNTVFSTFMHETPPESPAACLYCGDEDAKPAVAQLIRDVGFEPIDVGGADATPLLESFARIVAALGYTQGRGPFVYRFESS
jgi:predicted dinucleotide-binding enzyme